jgi:hypothetical protein
MFIFRSLCQNRDRDTSRDSNFNGICGFTTMTESIFYEKPPGTLPDSPRERPPSFG